jgi:hypothetical protein
LVTNHFFSAACAAVSATSATRAGQSLWQTFADPFPEWSEVEVDEDEDFDPERL